jgi:hypothetical protein
MLEDQLFDRVFGGYSKYAGGSSDWNDRNELSVELDMFKGEVEYA